MVSPRWLNNAIALDQILDSAWQRVLTGGGVLDEPHFVRELISPLTINALNRAAVRFYPLGQKSIYFTAGFIHGLPLATFVAKTATGYELQKCTRELADIIIMLNETAPDNNGRHHIVRRSACLVMFKKKQAKNPSTIRFPPGVKLPRGTDNEQFYLYNQWPPFNLQLSQQSSPVGTFFINNSSGHAHSFSKFGALWDHKKNKSTWPSHWLYANPVPSIKLKNSLGELLLNMVDNHPDAGRLFSFNPPGNGPKNDWDKLMSVVYHYAARHSWGAGRSRLVPPAMRFNINPKDYADCDMGTKLQFASQANHRGPNDAGLQHAIRHRLHTYAALDSNALFTPVLFITSHNFARYD